MMKISILVKPKRNTNKDDEPQLISCYSSLKRNVIPFLISHDIPCKNINTHESFTFPANKLETIMLIKRQQL